jgi:hypothetical protein
MIEFAGSTPIENIMLAGGAIMAVQIAMIFFSRVLKYKVNRWANIIVGLLTVVYVVGGGSTYPHYLLLGALEVFVVLYIIYTAWKWNE